MALNSFLDARVFTSSMKSSFLPARFRFKNTYNSERISKDLLPLPIIVWFSTKSYLYDPWVEHPRWTLDTNEILYPAKTQIMIAREANRYVIILTNFVLFYNPLNTWQVIEYTVTLKIFIGTLIKWCIYDAFNNIEINCMYVFNARLNPTIWFRSSKTR